MPAVLLRLFSANNSDDRGEELKKTLGISGKSAFSVTELEKQFLQPSSSQEVKQPSENLPKPIPIATKVCLYSPLPVYSQIIHSESNAINTGLCFN